MTIQAVSEGFGRRVQYLSQQQRESIGLHTIIVFIVALWTSAFARISWALLLLQFTASTTWRVLLKCMVGFDLVILVINETIVLTQCRPMRAMWDVVPDAQCFTVSQTWASAVFVVGMRIYP